MKTDTARHPKAIAGMRGAAPADATYRRFMGKVPFVRLPGAGANRRPDSIKERVK